MATKRDLIGPRTTLARARVREDARARRRPMSIDEVLTVLEETPRTIGALTAGLPRVRLQKTKVLDEWTVNDVLAHLRSCSDARGEFMRAMLAERRPTLRAIDPRGLIEQTGYRELQFAPSFRAFEGQRAASVVPEGTVAHELVAHGRGDRRRAGARADRAVLRGVARSPRTSTCRSSDPHASARLVVSPAREWHRHQ